MNPEIDIERILDADVKDVWLAITDRDLMAQWYFNLKEFKAQVGFTFEFLGGPEDGIKYNHLCEITELIHEEKLSYSWRYEGYDGNTIVTFSLIPVENGKTRLHFSHSGLSSFPPSNPDFALGNFKEGWNYFINIALPEFLSK
ncbi:MAG: SRPBCC domain-containing protein [Saprospiraceae bacterium]|nr:SRPBCC domain-containing protein [Saprospiraceae bacterium]